MMPDDEKFTLDEHADLIRFKIVQARAGNKASARFLLEEFVNHADVFKGADIPQSDREVLSFMEHAVREILDKVPPNKALCLSGDGRGRVPILRDINLALAVYDHLQSQPAGEERDIALAKRTVARRRKASFDTVEKVWTRLGSLEGVTRLAQLRGERAEWDTELLQWLHERRKRGRRKQRS